MIKAKATEKKTSRGEAEVSEEEEDDEEDMEHRKETERDSLMRQQIERNNEWIEKMSPVVKYKIQEYIRKQKNKKMQRRKFSLACGLRNLVKQEPSTTASARRRSKRVASEAVVPRTAKVVVLQGTTSEMEAAKGLMSSGRRKSAPAQKMDMGDLDDLE